MTSESTGYGGTEAHTLRLLSALTERGHEVDVIESGADVLRQRSDPRLSRSPVRFHQVALSTDSPAAGSLTSWISILRATRATHGILIKNWNPRGGLPFLAALRWSFPRVSFIEHLDCEPLPKHSGAPYLGFIPRPGLWIQLAKIRRWLPSMLTDRVVAVSESVRGKLIAECRYPARKVLVARNGVAWQDFTRKPDSSLRTTFSIPGSCRLMTMLVRLEHAKAVDVALQALALARRQSARPLHLLIAGTGSLEGQLKALASSLDLLDCVTFAGFMPDPRPALWASDAILFSSRQEGLPLGLLEGMAAGCAPIVTRVSGMPEVVASPELGWVVAPGNPAALAHAMQEMAEMSDTALAGLRARAAEHIRTDFDLDRSLERLLQQLEIQ